MKTKQKSNNILLLVITSIFVFLFSLTLFLFNLHLVLNPQFVKRQLRDSGIYQSVASQLKQSWFKGINGGQQSSQDLETALEQGFNQDWLRGEAERNLDELNNYINSDGSEFTFNIELTPAKEKIIAHLKDQDKEMLANQINQSMPEKVDIFGEQGFLKEEGRQQLYELKVTIEATKLSLKILLFLLIFSLLTFFFLNSSHTAWQWVGISLVSAGLLVFALTFFLKTVGVDKLLTPLVRVLPFASEIIEIVGQLFEELVSVYLSLIQWQSLASLLLGLLVLLVASIWRLRD